MIRPSQSHIGAIELKMCPHLFRINQKFRLIYCTGTVGITKDYSTLQKLYRTAQSVGAYWRRIQLWVYIWRLNLRNYFKIIQLCCRRHHWSFHRYSFLLLFLFCLCKLLSIVGFSNCRHIMTERQIEIRCLRYCLLPICTAQLIHSLVKYYFWVPSILGYLSK